MRKQMAVNVRKNMKRIQYCLSFLISLLVTINCFPNFSLGVDDLPIEINPSQNLSLEKQMYSLKEQIPDLENQALFSPPEEIFKQMSQIILKSNQLIKSAEERLPLQSIKEAIEKENGFFQNVLIGMGFSENKLTMRLEEIKREIEIVTQQTIDLQADLKLKKALHLAELAHEQFSIICTLGTIEKGVELQPGVEKMAYVVHSLAWYQVRILTDLKMVMQFIDLMNKGTDVDVMYEKVQVLEKLIKLARFDLEQNVKKADQTIGETVDIMLELRKNQEYKQLAEGIEKLEQILMQRAIQLIELTTEWETLLKIMRIEKSIPEDTIKKAEKEVEESIRLIHKLADNKGYKKAFLLMKQP